ncbi:diguanylate cyclase [Maridesulfovibrio sp.]|uniref:sensor domain-containing diguanylate cyclase n=1 Tax=Maridesulfovibrio sp. TaxID=2795000 RepID=UPI002A18E3F7|nr:diguanylate cyclase [Maridesulfovibrio sp.]
MSRFPDTEDTVEYGQLKKAYEELKKLTLEKCPECGQVRFRDLFDGAASAIAVLDSLGNVLCINNAFRDLSGYASSEIIGQPLCQIVTKSGDTEGREFLENIFSTPDLRSNLSMPIVDRHQEQHYVDLSIANVDIGSGQRNSICIFSDVTSERENEMRREELIEELMEAKELQEDNSARLTMLLHELDEKNLELETEVAERKKAEALLRESEERFKNLSITDQLTGLFNRRHMVDVAEREVSVSNKMNSPLSFILMDIDDFKVYNDTYGHAAGDVVLARVGRIIRETVRDTDLAFRYGGEEFLIVLPVTDGPTAMQLAEEIRKAVSRERYYPAGNGVVQKTMSIGVAQYLIGEPLEKVLKRADDNMYKSKIRGKNKVYFSCETGDSQFG